MRIEPVINGACEKVGCFPVVIRLMMAPHNKCRAPHP